MANPRPTIVKVLIVCATFSGSFFSRPCRQHTKSSRSGHKRKGKKAEEMTFSSGPPVSNEQTVVWHFELNGIECTVMYDKQDMTVWCNGEDLETVDGFSETGLDGSVLDFYITLDDNTAHRGRIQRVRSEKSLAYQLIVNGLLIQERTHVSQAPQVVPSDGASYDQQAYAGYNGYFGAGGGGAGTYGGATGYGAYNGTGQDMTSYNGLPSAAVYEPPPKYEDIMEKKMQ
ncbi:hypothetical protein LSH36_797g00006 [Paralvinella palmiformis]|uniref:Uncharacterized protein n=1 Tax=Paralvinella palmiformis TaxID=53620 RepID=A0AAD9IZU0_9ANNE|nr:hypothetical protein LSH36_797g00006 [Paralvinella palmiformis]